MRNILQRFFHRNSEKQPSDILPALQQANQLFAVGNYSAACSAFDNLARRGERQGSPGAPFYFIQAGRASVLLGDFAAGMAYFKHGLSLLAVAKRYAQLYRVGTRIIQELSGRGLEKEAREISTHIRRHTPAFAEMPTERQPKTRPALSSHCLSCGGPLRADDIEWLDDETAECPFCRNPVHAG